MYYRFVSYVCSVALNMNKKICVLSVRSKVQSVSGFEVMGVSFYWV